MIQRFLVLVWLLMALFSLESQARVLDRIVAVVDEEVILERELNQEVANFTAKLRGSNMAMPPEYVVRGQVLEHMIVDRLQKQLAAKNGIQISDEQLRNQIAEIAARNNMSVEAFQDELKKSGMDFKRYEESLRNEIVIGELRRRMVAPLVKVTDAEVAHYMETQSTAGQNNSKYRIGHILIAVSEAASASIIQKAKEKADQVVADLRGGKDFKQMAVGVSNDDNALKGGDLGWRSMSQIPTLFVDAVAGMHQGDISDPIRSPSGFHIIKILEVEGEGQHLSTKTKVRHILIKTNDLIDDAEAQKRLLGLRERIMSGEDFGSLAHGNSDDKGSAINGGSLDWVVPGALVPPFEDAMNKLEINEISKPVQTQFGWHIIQVLGRERQDNSEQFKKEKVRDEIRKRKIDEETELWLRRLRDEAYVEIELDKN